MTNVDVIIPVYRGLEETSECIISASKTLPDWANLIVVNDCTPEPELLVWLRENNDKYNYKLYENELNLGFVATVNFAMSLNDNDVLLLNSDVEVENDWLERIHEVAYLADDIASVTPFSNNATICSYPNFCKDNHLAQCKSVKEIDLAFSRANKAEDYIDIPTGVGFCMYIKRASLNDVGLFDVDTFGKGYGEENDWCQSAIKNGWRNVHAVNVFAYHKGGVSFVDEQHPRQKVALELLLKKHPNYTADVMSFVNKDPAKFARLRVAIELVRSSEKSVLQVEHALKGGVSKHVDDLVAHLEPESVSVRLRQFDNAVELIIDESNAVTFDVNRDGEILLALLRYLNFGKVHYHHIHGLDNNFLNLPEYLSVQYIITVHDYYLVNGNSALSSETGEFFGDEPNESVLKKSESNRLSGFKFADREGRSRLLSFVTEAELLIYPSKDTLNRFCRFYDVSEKSIVAYHKEDNTNTHGVSIARNNERKVRVLVIGAISLEKGAVILNGFAKKYAFDYEIHLLGYSCISLDNNIIDHGKYEQSELVCKIETISPDIVWYTSQCAETYCYTLTPAITLGLPIVAPQIGAFTERLMEISDAILLKNYNCYEAISNAINTLYQETKNQNFTPKLRNVIVDDFYSEDYLSMINIKVDSNNVDFDFSSLMSLLKSSENKKTTKQLFYQLTLKIYHSHFGRIISKLVPPHSLRKMKRILFG